MMDYEDFKLDRDKGMGFYKKDDSYMLDVTFIRYYEIIANDIHIHTSKKIMVFPYSKELEIKVLNKMGNQINEYKKIIESKNTNGRLMVAYLINSFVLYFLSFATNNPYHIISGSLWLSFSSFHALPFFNKIIKLNDIKNTHYS